jgi:hypothetical protein
LGASMNVYKIFGLKGRQLGEYGEWVRTELPSSLKVLTYRTYSGRAMVSLRARERMLGLGWEARWRLPCRLAFRCGMPKG